MKRKISFFLAAVLALSLLIPSSAFAIGDGNIDSGGGGLGGGTKASYWNPGYDGVRLTVVTKEGNQVTLPIDLTNINASGIACNFGKMSKISYVNGTELSLSDDSYAYYNPEVKLPRIISSSYATASLAEIKSYFTDQVVIQYIADLTGMDYDTLISGKYKLLLEPIGYFVFNYTTYAMTATEAALYDEITGGTVRSALLHFSNMNLPLAMYLDVADLGFSAYTGSTSDIQDDDTIIWQLGLGIVSFTNDVKKTDDDANYEYRTDTDVITSLTLANNGDNDVTPDKNCKVVFNILGATYEKPFICPCGNRQLIWVKWHTPSTPQKVVITVHGVGFNMTSTITANIVQLTEQTPPDPQYADTNKGFKLADTPNYGNSTSASWNQWIATWVPPLTLDDTGYWSFSQKTYSVSLNVDFMLSPDTRVKTAKLQSNHVWEMKSGYGIDADSKTSVYTSGSPNFTTDYTQAQNEISTFSDFGFVTYNRFLEPEDRISTNTDWHFKKNIDSYYGCHVHFTPLWYPDETNYEVALSVIDVWTPAGMLYTTASDHILIDGNVYADWYIHLK